MVRGKTVFTGIFNRFRLFAQPGNFYLIKPEASVGLIKFSDNPIPESQVLPIYT